MIAGGLYLDGAFNFDGIHDFNGLYVEKEKIPGFNYLDGNQLFNGQIQLNAKQVQLNMANLTEKNEWSDVYQLERNDPVLAGPGGIMNRQAQALLNRTNFLRANKADLAQVNQIQTEFNEKLSAVSGGYFKSYATLSEANADIANIPLNVTVKVLSATEGGDYYKPSLSASSLIKAAYDLQNQIIKDPQLTRSGMWFYQPYIELSSRWCIKKYAKKKQVEF